MNDFAIHDFLYFPKGVKSPVLATFTLGAGPMYVTGFKLERWGLNAVLSIPKCVLLEDDEAMNEVRSAALAEFNKRMMEEA